MLDQNITTLLATILGGILATTGGIIATFYAQSLNGRTEREKFVRERCEEVYELAEKVKQWLDNENARWWCDYCESIDDVSIEVQIGRSKLAKEPLNCPIDRLMMIVLLYIPEFRTKAEELKNVVNTYNRFSNNFDEYGWRGLDEYEDFRDHLRKVSQEGKDTHQELKLIIEKTTLMTLGKQRPGNNDRTKKTSQERITPIDVLDLEEEKANI
jgi:hypothetical protein